MFLEYMFPAKVALGLVRRYRPPVLAAKSMGDRGFPVWRFQSIPNVDDLIDRGIVCVSEIAWLLGIKFIHLWVITASRHK